MLGRLFLIFTLTTALELWILIKLGALMGLGPTLALIVTTGFVGAWLTRREGLRTLSRLREQLSKGELPADAVLDGVCILIAGTFLVTPGILTDAVGFSLLVPILRQPIKRVLRGAFERAVAEGRASGRVTFVQAGRGGADVIDVSTLGARPPGVGREPVLRPRSDRLYASGDVIDVTDA